MKPSSLLILAVFLSVGLSLGAFELFRQPAATTSPLASDLERLSKEIEKLTREQKSLSESIGSIQTKAEFQPAAPARYSQKDIEDAVERALAARKAESEFDSLMTKGDAKPTTASGKASPGKLDLKATLDQINRTTDWPQRQALWVKIREAGMIDAAVEAYEQLAEDNPNNPDMQVAAGAAYLQKLQTVTDGPEKGTWAMKADKVFDDALKLDDHHWAARFTKATSLSFWPPVFGKQNEAIQNFEVLMKQQEEGPSKPDYVQTYMFLGNMYQQTGKADKAKEVYKKGLAIFPDNEELKKQLNLAK